VNYAEYMLHSVFNSFTICSNFAILSLHPRSDIAGSVFGLTTGCAYCAPCMLLVIANSGLFSLSVLHRTGCPTRFISDNGMWDRNTGSLTRFCLLIDSASTTCFDLALPVFQRFSLGHGCSWCWTDGRPRTILFWLRCGIYQH
jgi:hypothetical protein